MLNPGRPKDFTRLVNAVSESILRIGPLRKKRNDALNAFTGSEYTDDKAVKKTYLNLLAMATNIYVRQCAVRAPTARVVTPFQELRPLARDLTLACKDIAEEVRLGRLLRRAVMEALFSPMAVVKVGLESVGIQKLYGQDVDVTNPWVKLVSFDDFFIDMSARSAFNPSFMGDTYYMPWDELLKVYPKAKTLKPPKGDVNFEEADGDRNEYQTHDNSEGSEDIDQKVAVRDVWLTKERRLVTYLPSKPDFPLADVLYDTTDMGPFELLYFTEVPDNQMPQPPFPILKNIHDTANSLFRRMREDARNHKRVVAFSDEEDADNFKRSLHGDGMYLNGADPRDVEVGGINNATMAMFLQVKDLFSWAAGNLDTLGGLSPMAETARQEDQLAQSASGQIQDMQDATTEFAQKIFKRLAWYEWTDPVRKRKLRVDVPGVDNLTMVVDWTNETRQGDFLDFNFSIIPQSMREDSPAAKIKRINAVMNEMVMPALPLFEKQGMTIDVKGWIKLVSDYSNIPELERLVVAVNEEMALPGPQGNPNPMPRSTKRTYERVNRPGATRVGKEAALTQTLMGGKAQASEMNSISRSVS